MSFTCILQVEDQAFPVLQFLYHEKQQKDASNRPVSVALHDGFEATIELSQHTLGLFWAWMVSPDMLKDGSFCWERRDGQGTYYQLEFWDAYCVDFQLNADFTSAQPSTVTIRLSPQRHSNQGVPFIRQWPGFPTSVSSNKGTPTRYVGENIPLVEDIAVEKSLKEYTQAELEDFYLRFSQSSYQSNKLKHSTIEHKAVRWAEYKQKRKEKAKAFEMWSNIYHGNMGKPEARHKGVDEYHNSIGKIGVREVTISVFTENGKKQRRLDIADKSLLWGIEMKEYQKGTVHFTNEIKEEVSLDKLLIAKQGWEIKWVFKGCKPSASLQKELDTPVKVDYELIK